MKNWVERAASGLLLFWRMMTMPRFWIGLVFFCVVLGVLIVGLVGCGRKGPLETPPDYQGPPPPKEERRVD